MRSRVMKSTSPANQAWYCVFGIEMKKMICSHTETGHVVEILLTCLLDTDDFMANDDLMTQGARAAAALILS